MPMHYSSIVLSARNLCKADATVEQTRLHTMSSISRLLSLRLPVKYTRTNLPFVGQLRSVFAFSTSSPLANNGQP